MNRSIEWAAGLFEGEGTIVIRERHRSESIQIAVYNTDEDVIREFSRVIRTGAVKGPFIREKYKEMWQWCAYGDNARDALLLLSPFFLKRRKDKSIQALSIIPRTRRYIEYNNELHSLVKWSKMIGIPYRVLKDRLFKLNWSVQKAFTTPKL